MMNANDVVAFRWRALRAIALAGSALGVIAGTVAFASYRMAMREADRAWRHIALRTTPPAGVFDPAMVADLPDVARRYFAHAIAPGTPLRTTVELQMNGTFLLGDINKYQAYAMEARQILRPPAEFIWIPRMKSGIVRVTGSDALVNDHAWTRFWLNGVVPVVNEASSPDLVRSAEFRSAVEGIWVPSSLLPQNGVEWEQVGRDRARISMRRLTPAVVIEITLNHDGSVREVVGRRWSNANPQKTFRLQPFGGTIHGEATFGGYTIPNRLSVGNHFGTADYLPFFQVEVTHASYL